MATTTYSPPAVSDISAASQREALVLAHLPQVRLIASRIHDRLPDHISLEDLISTGVVGLLNAIDNFDPSYNVQLKTYAERRIHGAIMDSLREIDWAPREMRRKAKLIQASIDALKSRLGREPAEEEIAAELKITLDEYYKWLADAKSLEIQRLEYASPDGSTCDLLNLISDDEDSWPSRVVEKRELTRLLALAIDRIPKLERTVLCLYYFEELTLREIAEITGLHLSRIGQLRVQAVLRLRSHLDRIWKLPGGDK